MEIEKEALLQQCLSNPNISFCFLYSTTNVILSLSCPSYAIHAPSPVLLI